MSVEVQLVQGPLAPLAAHDDDQALGTDGQAGAFVLFEGIVRSTEADQPISGLQYQAYEPMAQDELHKLAHKALKDHDLISVRVWHSKGMVAVGKVSFRLLITSAHRKQALAAMDGFIDALKCDVPIWKTAVYERSCN